MNCSFDAKIPLLYRRMPRHSTLTNENRHTIIISFENRTESKTNRMDDLFTLKIIRMEMKTKLGGKYIWSGGVCGVQIDMGHTECSIYILKCI